MKRVVCIIAIALIVSMFTVSYSESIQPYASSVISSTSLIITPNSNGTISLGTSIVGTKKLTKVGFTSLTIQAYIDGSWQSVYRISNKFSYDSTAHAYSYTYDSVKDRQYRMVVNFYASDGSTTDTRTRTSGSVTSK